MLIFVLYVVQRLGVDIGIFLVFSVTATGWTESTHIDQVLCFTYAVVSFLRSLYAAFALFLIQWLAIQHVLKDICTAGLATRTFLRLENIDLVR